MTKVYKFVESMDTKTYLQVIAGLILTIIFHKTETSRRLYRAIGGEFLILPLIIVIKIVRKSFIEATQEV